MVFIYYSSFKIKDFLVKPKGGIMGILSWLRSRSRPLIASPEIGTFLAKFAQVRLEPVYDSLGNSRWMQRLQQLSPGKKLTVEVALHTIGIFLANKIGKDGKLAAMLRELVEDASPEVVSRMRRYVQSMEVVDAEFVYRNALIGILDLPTHPPKESVIKREAGGIRRLTKHATNFLRESAARNRAKLQALKEGRS